jgi:hypothetical protein
MAPRKVLGMNDWVKRYPAERTMRCVRFEWQSLNFFVDSLSISWSRLAVPSAASIQSAVEIGETDRGDGLHRKWICYTLLSASYGQGGRDFSCIAVFLDILNLRTSPSSSTL